MTTTPEDELTPILNQLFEQGADARFRYGNDFGKYPDFMAKKTADVAETLEKIRALTIPKATVAEALGEDSTTPAYMDGKLIQIPVIDAESRLRQEIRTKLGLEK